MVITSKLQNGDHKWLRLINAYILYALFAANRKGNFKFKKRYFVIWVRMINAKNYMIYSQQTEKKALSWKRDILLFVLCVKFGQLP